MVGQPVLKLRAPGAQLARNKRLDSFFVRDLNAEPGGWALADQSFDAVLCCVSVQYLQQARGGAGLLRAPEFTPCMAGTEVQTFFTRYAECLASCAVDLTGMRMLRAVPVGAGRAGAAAGAAAGAQVKCPACVRPAACAGPSCVRGAARARVCGGLPRTEAGRLLHHDLQQPAVL